MHRYAVAIREWLNPQPGPEADPGPDLRPTGGHFVLPEDRQRETHNVLRDADGTLRESDPREAIRCKLTIIQGRIRHYEQIAERAQPLGLTIPEQQSLDALRASEADVLAELSAAEAAERAKHQTTFTGCFPPCAPMDGCPGCDEQRARLAASHENEEAELLAEIDALTRRAVDYSVQEERCTVLNMVNMAAWYKREADRLRVQCRRRWTDLHELRTDRGNS